MIKKSAETSEKRFDNTKRNGKQGNRNETQNPPQSSRPAAPAGREHGLKRGLLLAALFKLVAGGIKGCGGRKREKKKA
jgi:hypothetical protein